MSSTSRCSPIGGGELRHRFLDGADAAAGAAIAHVADDELAPLVQNSAATTSTSSSRPTDRATTSPSVVFAYTVKGWGLPIAGDPLNHATLLSAARIEELRASIGLTAETEWDRFDPDSPGKLCDATGSELGNVPVPPRPTLLPIPEAAGVPAAGST